MIYACFYGPNAGYVLELYDRYQRNPQSVDAATQAFFAQFSTEELAGVVQQPPAPPAATAPASLQIDVTRTVGAARYIRYIRELGHMIAQIDPAWQPAAWRSRP